MFSVLVTPLTLQGAHYLLDIIAPWWETLSPAAEREMWAHLTGDVLDHPEREAGPGVRSAQH